MKKIVIYAITFVASTWVTSADASPILIIDANGSLTGATGVLVNDRLYDVEFVDATCAEVFGICDTAHFTFTTESSALAASQALIDQVLIDVFGLGTSTLIRP